MNGTIYSKADYWTTGSWTRKIQIADLDVPATLKLNQQRGLNFVLPASSNEVVSGRSGLHASDLLLSPLSS